MSESRKMSPWVERAGGGYASKEKSIEHRAGTSGRDEGSPSISWTLTSEHPPGVVLSTTLPFPVLLSQTGRIRRRRCLSL